MLQSLENSEAEDTAPRGEDPKDTAPVAEIIKDTAPPGENTTEAVPAGENTKDTASKVNVDMVTTPPFTSSSFLSPPKFTLIVF